MERRDFLQLIVGTLFAKYLPIRPANKILMPRLLITPPAQFSIGYEITHAMLEDDMYGGHKPWW